MTLHEEITALLQGDVTDPERVAELMHVLAVSPEKQSIFIEQIQLTRALTSLAGSITPPRRADHAIWQGLAAVDAAIAGTPQGAPVNASEPEPAEKPAAGARLGARFGTRGGAAVASLLLMGLLFGVAYMLPGGTGIGERTNSAGSERALPGMVRRATAADEVMLASAFMAAESPQLHSLTDLRSQLADLNARYQAQTHLVEALRSRGERVRVVYRDRPAVDRVDLQDAGGNGPQDRAMQPAAPKQLESEPQGQSQAPVAIARVEPRAPVTSMRSNAGISEQPETARRIAMNGSSPLDEDLPAASGPWQVGVRDQFRLSLPRVYGLAGNRTILFDKELLVSYHFGGENSLLSAMRLSLAAGETQFAQIFHTNVGGQPSDSIVMQSPSLQYARLLLAPELVRTKSVTGALEIGAGLATSQLKPVGPMASFGVNLEYRPIDRFSINVGTSAWMLWSQHLTSTVVSTNLNGHLGFAVGF
ncbi:MAG TPA: hypothetical protein VHI13_12910 [Candidatus Kapabacteria bacterium]|nr:hypothetical protein [Candidatus Kapabacteria bacterium]